ncbi:MAG: DUF4364 family protein [Clostridiales bacterium]|nr:DUF4364 family protein [Clostridiales bacterium]
MIVLTRKETMLRVAENKLIILYLIDKMDIPMSNSQISQFALEQDYMNYFSLQQCLAEMAASKFLESTQENNNTRYTVTDTGLQILDYFENNIPSQIRNKIINYVKDNRKILKRDFEITANYFYDHKTNEYIVKCGVYEDEVALMELNVSVVTKDQAKIISNNWKANVSSLYSSIISQLTNPANNNLKGGCMDE